MSCVAKADLLIEFLKALHPTGPPAQQEIDFQETGFCAKKQIRKTPEEHRKTEFQFLILRSGKNIPFPLYITRL